MVFMYCASGKQLKDKRNCYGTREREHEDIFAHLLCMEMLRTSLSCICQFGNPFLTLSRSALAPTSVTSDLTNSPVQ